MSQDGISKEEQLAALSKMSRDEQLAFLEAALKEKYPDGNIPKEFIDAGVTVTVKDHTTGKVEATPRIVGDVTILSERPDIAKEDRIAAMMEEVHESMGGKGKLPELYIKASNDIAATAEQPRRWQKSSEKLVITTALLDSIKDDGLEDTLKPIIAHELGHFPQNRFRSLIETAATIGTGSGMATVLAATTHPSLGALLASFAVGGIAASTTTSSMINRHNEYDADKKAGEVVGPEAMIGALHTMQDIHVDALESGGKISAVEKVLDHLRHPSDDKRIARLNKQAERQSAAPDVGTTGGPAAPAEQVQRIAIEREGQGR